MNSTVRMARRSVRNVVNNYSEVQVKVRQATSNDPWGPSASLMSQIADCTHNIVSFTDIMQIVWRRLNDHGKNWRHVLKSLVLLDYLVKNGNERVAQQCSENIYVIESLRDFQYFELGADQVRRIRDRSVQLVELLRDEERLAAEREKSKRSRQRMRENGSGFGSDSERERTSSPIETTLYLHQSMDDVKQAGHGDPAAELVRPKTADEEKMQLQLALQISKQEADRRQHQQQQQLQLQQQYERLQMTGTGSATIAPPWSEPSNMAPKVSAFDDLVSLDVPCHAAVGSSPVTRSMTSDMLGGGHQANDPWQLGSAEANGSRMFASSSSGSLLLDPWSANTGSACFSAQPVQTSSTTTAAAAAAGSQMASMSGYPSAELAARPPPIDQIDPWSSVSPNVMPSIAPATSSGDIFAPSLTAITPSTPAASGQSALSRLEPPISVLDDPWNSCLTNEKPALDLAPPTEQNQPMDAPHSDSGSQSVNTFLNVDSKLISLDNLVGLPKAAANPVNPFATGGPSCAANPFYTPPSTLSMNELKIQQREHQMQATSSSVLAPSRAAL